MSDPDIVIATFIAYLAVLAILGVLAYRQTRDIADFVLGGRRLGRWITALSAGASDMSGWLLLGLPGYAYLAGLESLWIALGLGLGTWGNWHLVALRLRVFSQLADDALTIPEFLANRFGSDRPLLPVLSAVVILLFFLVYTAAGLVAAGKLFETVFGMPYLLAVALGLAAIVLYTAAGGFLAVSWTDAVQAGLMFFALLLVPVVALGQTGGVAGAWQLLDAVAPQLLNPFTDAQGETLGLLAVISLLAWGLGDEVIGNETKVKVVKNKVAPPFKQAQFEILYGEGVSRHGEIIELGVRQGIIEKSGAWYSYGKDRIGQGKENVRQFLRDNPDVAATIEAQIRATVLPLDAADDETAVVEAEI